MNRSGLRKEERMMHRTVFISNGEKAFNRQMASYLLDRGHSVSVQFELPETSDTFSAALSDDAKASFIPVVADFADRSSVADVIEHLSLQWEGIDLYIHGMLTEEEGERFEQDPYQLSECLNGAFRRLFLLANGVSAHMARKKSGQMLFPLLSDTLTFAGYPSSPIWNHGIIALVKCLAKEMSLFGVAVNCITFGYHDLDLDFKEKRNKQKQLDIYALKPPLPALDEMISALDMLIGPMAKYVSGQNLHIGYGLETIL